ncbi:MAG: SAM-dependent methyltransferase [Alphaproteobacteria bacterium]
MVGGAAVPERLVWAARRLGFAPGDRLLEIGCGQGVAASLVCAGLTGGRLVGLDRSPFAIAAALRRNAVHVAAGRAAFLEASLAGADLAGDRFDIAFAVNVNLFWLKPARELPVVRAALAPGAPLHLFYQPPDARRTAPILERLHGNLGCAGFVVDKVHRETRGPAELLHLRARSPA